MVEESEKDHIEQIRDEYYRFINSNKTDKERIHEDIRSISMLLSSKVDDFGVESSFEGFDSMEAEDLIHYSAPSKFVKEDMDLLYEQDMTHYPDGNLCFNSFINNIIKIFTYKDLLSIKLHLLI